MKYRIYIFLLILTFFNIQALGQTSVSGFVRDSVTGERLIGANVLESSNTAGTITDNNGYFAVNLKMPAFINISFVGYVTRTVKISAEKDTLLQISLTPGVQLKEMNIIANNNPKPNVIRLDNRELLRIPSLTGKPDILKASQLMPGIKGQSEGSGLLLVRGGNPGENLYLLDNVSLIYVNHLGGFMSVFNPDIINNLDIYKGGFPARYGGKLSSVVDITQKEGNTAGRKGSYSLGVTDFSLTLEGPLSKKASYIFTGRKTFYELFSIALSSAGQGNTSIIAYGFHDVNGKVSWKKDDKNSFHLNIYQGDDYLNFWSKKTVFNDEKNRLKYVWGNWLTSANWKHVINHKIFSEQTVSYSRYRVSTRQKFEYREAGALNEVVSRDFSTVQDISVQSVWKYFPVDKWKVNFGAKSSLLFHLPNYSYKSDMGDNPDKEYIFSNESAIFVENDIELPAGFRMNAGLRLVNYLSAGFSVLSPEPRLLVEKRINGNMAVNAGVTIVNQYSHLLFTPGAIMSNEVWVPSGKNIKPSVSNQYFAGWACNYAAGMYTAETNLYLKTLRNLITYKEGYLNLKGDNNWHKKVETGGKGTAYGTEILIKKNSGKWTGFVSYAYSRSLRQFPGINGGKEYVFEYDRPHTASVFVSHQFSRKLSFSLTWVYQTGLPYTPVIGRQLTQSLNPDENGNYIYYEAFIYGNRNSARMKDYHRLDLGLTLNRISPDNQVYAKWNFSVYNAYNRQNPVYYYYNTTATGEIINPETSGTAYKPFNMYQLTLFPVIPMVSYTRFINPAANKKISFKDRLRNLLFFDE